MMIETGCHVAYIPKNRLVCLGYITQKQKLGMCYVSMQVYTGANKKNTREKGLNYRLVMDVVENYKMKEHCLSIDNFSQL